MKVFILQGLPGSGKSSYVAAHLRAVLAARLAKFEEQMPSWWVRRTVE